jgi:hypothetical protein
MIYYFFKFFVLSETCLPEVMISKKVFIILLKEVFTKKKKSSKKIRYQSIRSSSEIRRNRPLEITGIRTPDCPERSLVSIQISLSRLLHVCVQENQKILKHKTNYECQTTFHNENWKRMKQTNFNIV